MSRRGLDPFDKWSMALSVAFHGSLFALMWASTLIERETPVFLTYEIEMVSPPPAVRAEEVVEAPEELVIETPEPDPTPPEPEAEEVAPIEDPDPDPVPATPPDPEPEPDPPPDPPEEEQQPAAPAEPEPEAQTSGEGLNVRIEGLRRDYPQYYENIIRQIRRCFRWRDGGSWQTTVFFWINRDGSVSDIRFERRSGNTAFDFEAMGAVDCAGQGRLGALPAELPYERFPVRFEFTPSGGGRTLFNDPAAHGAAPVTGAR